MKTLRTIIFLLALTWGATTDLRAELRTPDQLSPEMRACYDSAARMRADLIVMRDSAELVYRETGKYRADRRTVFNTQVPLLNSLDKIDDSILACEALMRYVLTGTESTPHEFRQTSIMAINCLEPEQAISLLENNLDKASPFIYNWLGLRAMESKEYVKAFRYFVGGIRKISDPDEPTVYYPLFHNLGIFLSRTKPYIKPEDVKLTQAQLDNNLRICVEQYTKAAPYLENGAGPCHKKEEYLTPDGPYTDSLNTTRAATDGLISGETLCKEYEHYNFWSRRSSSTQ